MIRILKRYKIVITIILVLILILGSIMIRIQLSEEDNIEVVENIKENDIVKEENTTEVGNTSIIYVDIKGAINNPGVYEIENNKRVIDVINKAGGLSDNANTSFVNLAKKVEDSMVVIIYTNEEIEKAKKNDNISYVVDNNCVCPTINNDACLDKNIKNSNNASNKNNDKTSVNDNIIDKININTASLLDLQTLPGVGESKAKAIIEYRDNEGSFSSIEDIKNVSGIGDSLYEKIKEYITV